MNEGPDVRLTGRAPGLARLLLRSFLLTPTKYDVASIRCETAMVAMRDGVRLSTDLYLPPGVPAPTIAVRTPYGRGMDGFVSAFLSLARRGYVVVAQDCRGTGASEPDSWDYYVNEPEDSYDLVEWTCQQPWFNGFLGSCGSSYLGQVQWQMGLHPSMSAIVPDVSGLGAAINTTRHHMFQKAYSRSVGKGEDKPDLPYFELEKVLLPETLATGYFNEPLHRPPSESIQRRFPEVREMTDVQAQRSLWTEYCRLDCRGRAQLIKKLLGIRQITAEDIESLGSIFGQHISHDRHTLPHVDLHELCASLHAPALLRTGWYDWGLNDALETWALITRAAPESVRSRCRLLIGPNAHNVPGYHEGMAEHPELHHSYGITTTLEVLLKWYETIQSGRFEEWPRVVYYLMGANEWCAADAWPLPGAQTFRLFLTPAGGLSPEAPKYPVAPTRYVYDPRDPTPTVGGSIVSFVYPPGSVDVSHVQKRSDVLVYNSEELATDLDVIGPLRFFLFASSSAVDTDFVVRLSDVFPDGRAVQLQNGVLRTRYRNLPQAPELLKPGQVYRLEIDMWATANRFKAGHRLRVDVSSADFPRFDRNSNRGGKPGEPTPAHQAVYQDQEHPSHLVFSVLGDRPFQR